MTGEGWISRDLPTIDLRELRESAEPHWFNVPNALTFLRALLVPFILWLLILDTPRHRWWAFMIFLFAAATDSVDGWVARRWHGITRWGQLADPIADKLLIIGSLTSLAAIGELPWWAVLVIVMREAAVTILRVRLIAHVDQVMPASLYGKAKTVLQIIAIGAYLAPDVSNDAAVVVLYAAVGVTVASGAEYAFRARRLARSVPAGTTGANV